MTEPCSLRPRVLSALFFLTAILPFAAATSTSDSDALHIFEKALSGGNADNTNALLTWDDDGPPCVGKRSKWAGIRCGIKGDVTGLQLENMSFTGPLRLDALAGIPSLRTISFMNNSFVGAIPSFKKLSALKSIFLSMNNFSGSIPDDAFARMGALKKLYLSQNRFNGSIPTSLTGLPRLLELGLDDNGFTGGIPDLEQPGLNLLNVSNNDLEGAIPESLSKFDASSFAGNKGLCGAPLATSCKKSSKKPSAPLVAAISVIAIGVVLVVIGTIFAMARRREEKKRARVNPKKAGSFKNTKRSSFREEKPGHGTADGSPKKPPVKPQNEQGKLVLLNALRGEREKFELDDLLKAAAEVLPGGTLGSCYKAILMDGPSVVVKRFKDMNAMGMQEFEEHMSRIGKLSHPNLLPLVAYYYKSQEKLLVTQFAPMGSLSNLLHGNSDMLGWPVRLKIVKGVARGLAYLHQSLQMLGLPHGHLKSSNVVLDETYEAKLTDYGLAPVMSQGHASQVMVACRAPEMRRQGRTTKKSDVWSLGILILEILTGKLADNTYGGSASRQREGKGAVNLAGWVNSVVREEWTGEVFDGGMKGTRGGEGEMLKLLRIGLACSEYDVEKRWEIGEALERIEELMERDGDEYYSSNASEGDAYSSRAMSQDDFSFSMNK